MIFVPLLARLLGDKAARIIAGLLPYLLAAGVLLAAYLWVHGMQETIARQTVRIAAAEKKASDAQAATLAEAQARKADVASLTTLAQGTVAVAVATKHDATIISETIDAKNPAPASPGLSAYIARLRQADTAASVQRAAGSTGGAASR